MLKACLFTLLVVSLLNGWAQPTIDGDGSDSKYTTLATWNQADTGFGDHGMNSLSTYEDGTYLYIMIQGECEANNNDFYVFINSWSDPNGLAASNALPNGSDGSSPFTSFNATMDFQVDFGIRLTVGAGTDAYVSIIDYRSAGITDTFLATIAKDGTSSTVGSGSYINSQFAYDHTGSLSGSGTSGWEMKIPLSAIGSQAGDSFEFLAMYGANDFISANTIPEIAGRSGNNLGADPSFTGFSVEHTFFARATKHPIVDGTDSGDTQYYSKATWTEGDTGFGDYGMVELKGREDGYNLHLFVSGVVENKTSNFIEFYIYINSSSETNGLAAGNQLPAGSDGGSPFANARPTLDMEVDYALRLTVGNSVGYVSIIDYTSAGNTDTYLGQIAIDGTPVTFYATGYEGIQTAYDHGTDLTTHTNEGWELRIPLALIGANAEDDFELFAMYGDDNSISANTLPEITGQGGTSLGSNPDFTGITGNQYTATSTLPVELLEFKAILKDSFVDVRWSTATELNNDYFDIQKSVDGRSFTSLARVNGHGTSSNVNHYSINDPSPYPGISYYRLVQVDYNGDVTSYPNVVVHSSFDQTILLYPNPVQNDLQIQFEIAAENQVSIIVCDGLGRRIIQESLQLNQGIHSHSINTQSLKTGIYLIQIMDRQGRQLLSQHLIKK